MAAILGFSLCVLLVLLVIPESPLGRLLHRQLVERPLEALSDIKRHQVIFLLLMVGFALGGGEAIAILGTEFIASYAIYLDAVMVTYALSAIAMVRRGGGWFRHVAMRFVRPMRPRRKRTARTAAGPRKSANDDDPAPALLVA